MSDFAVQTILAPQGGYDAQTLGALAGSPAASFLESMNLGHLQGETTGKTDVDRVLVEFQSVLVTEMLKSMRASIPESDLLGPNSGREIFESLLDQEYARSVSEKTGGLGLTEILKTQLGLVDTSSGLVARS